MADATKPDLGAVVKLRNCIDRTLEACRDAEIEAPLTSIVQHVCGAAASVPQLQADLAALRAERDRFYRERDEARNAWQVARTEVDALRERLAVAEKKRDEAVWTLDSFYRWTEADPRQRAPIGKIIGFLHRVIPKAVEELSTRHARTQGAKHEAE